MPNIPDNSFAEFFDSKARKSARQTIPVLLIAAALGPLVSRVLFRSLWNRFVAAWIAVCIFEIGVLLLLASERFGPAFWRIFEKSVGGTDRTDHPGRWVP